MQDHVWTFLLRLQVMCCAGCACCEFGMAVFSYRRQVNALLSQADALVRNPMSRLDTETLHLSKCSDVSCEVPAMLPIGQLSEHAF